MRISNDDASASPNSHAQFQVGFSLAAPITQSIPLYIQTGLDFTGRGAESGDSSYNLYYLQLPVTISYYINAGKIVSIRPYAGIYYSAGLFSNGKEDGERLKYDDDNFDFFTEYSVEFEGATSSYKALKGSDFGLRFGADVVLKKHYSVGLGYDLGLMNINKDLLDSSVKIKNGVFYIRLGYNF